MISTNERLVKVETKITDITEDIHEIKLALKEIKLALESNFVTQIEFSTYKSNQAIQKLLLSLINLIFGALLGVVIKTLLG